MIQLGSKIVSGGAWAVVRFGYIVPGFDVRFSKCFPHLRYKVVEKKLRTCK